MPSDIPHRVFVVGGFGHVGLPFGLFLADAGIDVVLHDTNDTVRPLVESGSMPFLEYGADEILQRTIGRTLHLSGSLAEVAEADTVVVTIGTPVDEYLTPKLLPMLSLAEELGDHLRAGQHVMLRSTVSPGTTERLHQYFNGRGLDVRLSFCPERIVQSRAIDELARFPQIVSGATRAAAVAAEALFERAGVRTIRVSVHEAELAKLFTNSWRYIQFAIANQFFMMATERGADFSRIYAAMTDGYDRAGGLPTPGFAAGPCLLKDTMHLSAAFQHTFQLGQAAMLINEGLPAFLIDQLERDGVNLAGARIGILGMAFKAETDDKRDSLSYKLAKILRYRGAKVSCSDEFIADPTFVAKEELVANADVVIVGAPHHAYRGMVMPADLRVVDLWGATKRDAA